MSARGQWQGMLMIARLNWPFYALSGAVLLLAMGALTVQLPFPLRSALALMAIVSVYFLFVSLGVSHLIYDRSDLYRWGWLNRALCNLAPQSIIFCHSGFDEASEDLKRELQPARWWVLDHYEPDLMTEHLIRRARALLPPTSGTIAARHDDWPLATASADVVFALLAVHEFRRPEQRVLWFGEAKRCFRAGGRIILVEHLRDLANFVAFGPGFLHFHPRSAWEHDWSEAGLHLHDEFAITPWVRVLVLSA